MLRSYTNQLMMNRGDNSYSDKLYNKRSNELAKTLLNDIASTGEVSLSKIIDMDAENFAKISPTFTEYDWPGLFIDQIVLGGNYKKSDDFIFNILNPNVLDRISAINAMFMGAWSEDHPFHMSPHEFDRKFFESWEQLNRQNKYNIIDPLVLDLDGDGIETVRVRGRNSVLFDHRANGIQHATGWVGKDDALLVLDQNGNGLIDNGRELFGDNTLLSDGTKANTGYQALSQYDENGDGVINAQDAVFAQLRAWRDSNQDGISQSDELLTMAEANVSALNLAHESHQRKLENGNLLARSGHYVRTDGTQAEMGDLHFAMNGMFSRIKHTTELSDEIKALPQLEGMGRLMDLQSSAARS